MNAIVIATTPGREEWLAQCLKSIGDRPVIVLSDYTFELGKIRWMYNNTNLDRWLLLQDSVVVKNPQIFDLLFSYPKSVAVSTCPVKFGMYLGVYHRETLTKVGMPQPISKEEAIHYERVWSDQYCAAEDVPVLFQDFTDQLSKGTQEIFGRVNLVLENDYLIKYKGTWAY
jgi:hypothetical protein